MDIQWYPGHMAKTITLLKSDIRLVDAVIVLLDARIPKSSDNPLIQKMLSDRNHIIVLNKSDLSDSDANRRWIAYFRQKGSIAVMAESVKGGGFQDVKTALKEAASARISADMAKGRRQRPIRTMVIGIPNVGKSSFINRITGRSAAVTGEKPGLTKGRQWIRINPEIEIMDTPGVLWPDLKERNAGMNLALTGAINDNRFDMTEAVLHLIRLVEDKYPNSFRSNFRVGGSGEVNEKLAIELLEKAGRNRGCIVKGGEVDIDRISAVVIDEFRSGKMGRITLETP